MFRNYFKMALKVLLRKKFYTFISMFGISMTLAVLLVVAAFWEHLVGQHAPEVHLDRSLIMHTMQMQKIRGGYSSGPYSDFFMETYVSGLQTPEMISFYTYPLSVKTFANGKKINVDQKLTNAAFWQVMKHSFLEGRPYTAEEVLRRQPITIIARSLKEDLFGLSSALGKEVKINQERFKVIGVIENTPVSRVHSYGTLFLPYTLAKDYGKPKGLTGEFMATLVAKDKSSIESMRQEYMAMTRNIELPPDIISIDSHADSYIGSWMRPGTNSQDESAGTHWLYVFLSVLLFLFLLLPTVNLVNLNISRIMERASEIGARKAFGASSKVIILQFIFENLVLTLLSGVLALLLAFVALQLINYAGIIQYMTLTINGDVLLAGMLITLLFGFLSGVYPAWRMSALQPAEALKAS